MRHACPRRRPHFYYRLHPEQDDGSYLPDLVKTVRRLGSLDVSVIAPVLHELADDYRLQVHKHVRHEERLPALWPGLPGGRRPCRAWPGEFSASTGSTLGISCLVSMPSPVS